MTIEAGKTYKRKHGNKNKVIINLIDKEFVWICAENDCFLHSVNIENFNENNFEIVDDLTQNKG